MIKWLTSKRNFGKIAIGLAVLAAVILFFGIVRPMFKAQVRLNDQKNELVLRRNAIAQTLANLKAVNHRKEQERLVGLNVLMPAEPDLLPGLSLIDFLAKQNGLELLSNRAGSSKQSNAVTADISGFLVQSAFSGEYLAVKNFLQAVYYTKRAIGINSLSLATQAEGTRVGLTASFFFPVATEKAKATSLEGAVSTFNPEENNLITSLANRSIVTISTASAALGRPNPFAKP